MGKYDVESDNKSLSDGGCRCSTAIGFLLVLLAIAIAVGVGLIVHFADKDSRDVTCNVNLTGLTSMSDNLAGCVALAQGNNLNVCNACPKPTKQPITTTTTATTRVDMTTTATMAITTEMPRLYPIRLPETLIPVSYTLWLRPDFYSNNQSEFMFHGRTSILVKAEATTRDVIMHAKDLNFADNSIIVKEENDLENVFDSYEFYGPSDLIIIKTNKDLVQGQNYKIEFTDFYAPIRQDFSGLYIGSWRENNETKYHVSTQMEPTFARLAFPCFDEPGMKATFDITLSRKSHVSAISNMPVVNSVASADGGWLDDVFDTTPVMSTYLLVFFIGDFTRTSITHDNRYEITSWSRRDQEPYRNYSLAVTPTLMDNFEGYFGVDYSLPKQDMIAMLSFPYGAMENWGAFVFREKYLLFDDTKNSAFDKYYVVAVISHECAHNWFGNIVSPAWWDDIWLNEAFASLMEYTGVHVVAPEWKPYELLFEETLRHAMSFDEQVTSHPMFIEGLEENDEIFAAFDVITYTKGGYLLHMVSRLMGEDAFAKGLNRYITEHAYSNAKHQDLWVALQAEVDAAGLKIPNLSAMMSTWIYQMGFPTVTVEFKEAGKIRLTQQRFLMDKTAEEVGRFTSSYGYKWDIPFTYYTSSDVTDDHLGDIILMNHTDDSVVIQSDRIPDPSGDAWVIGNLEGLVFMQVNYDQRNWDAITAKLTTDHTAIPTMNRMQLVHDAWTLAKTGDLNIATGLGLLGYLRNEREHGPWSLAFTELSFIGRMVARTPLWGKFYDFMQFTLQLSYLDFAPMQANGLSQILAQRLVLSGACSYDIPECITDARTTYAAWMADPQNKPAKITPDLFRHYSCQGVRHGGADEWEFMLELYQNTNTQTEKEAAVNALACTRHDWLIARYFSALADEGAIVIDDYRIAMRSIAMRNNAQMFWDWFRGHFDSLKERLPLFILTEVMKLMADGFNTNIRLQEFEHFVEEKGIGSHPMVMSSRAAIKGNVNWMEVNTPILKDWLDSWQAARDA